MRFHLILVRLVACLLCLQCFICFVNAQNIMQLPMPAKVYQNIEDFNLDSKLFTIIKPLNNCHYSIDTSKHNNSLKKWFVNKLLYQPFLSIDSVNYSLFVNPYVDLTFSSDNSLKINTRGIHILGEIKPAHLSFNTFFSENQAVFPDYMDDFISHKHVVPGQGYVRTFKGNGYDYSNAAGNITYKPSSYFTFILGHGKNFIGNGYRSLLLSDNAFSYPYFSVVTNVKKISYWIMYSSYMDLQYPHRYEAGFQKKYSTSHFLEYRVNKRISIGAFESVVWEGGDTLGNRGFDVNYLNPVIFYRPVEFSLNSPDNSIMGLNITFKPFKNIVTYAQLVIDDFNFSKLKSNGFFQEKYGYQFGMKYNKQTNRGRYFGLLEYNQVQPYVYAHKSPLQNYAHYNQALAHPLGANFKEILGIGFYKYRRFQVSGKLTYAWSGEDTSNSHWGKDIFKSDFAAQRDKHEYSYGNYNGQGLKTTLLTSQLSVGYIINPSYNLIMELGVQQNIMKNTLNSNSSNMVFVSLKTDLFNFYNDFR